MGYDFMISFIVKVNEFFQISRSTRQTEDFDNGVVKYVIPKYQREYKWSDDKVITLINDINNRDKFLGNIFLDKKDLSYEIVDGQQRITTVFLILVGLFNKLKDNTAQEINLEQRNILEFIIKNGSFILENESIGEFLVLNQTSINLVIDDLNDEYFQKETFYSLYNTILNELDKIEDKSNFVQKLLDCSFLILISNNPGYTTSIEQIFLDINFKSQLLDVEDIFKGYCFKNYWPQFHNELKDQWVKLKKNSRAFINIGYRDLSEFLYHYLLSKPDSYDIPQNLSPGGIHYLEGKNNNITKLLLDEMVNYSENINIFISALDSTTYFLLDLCNEYERFRNTQGHIVLKSMCKLIVENRVAQYHKLPFFMLIHYFKKNPQYGQEILYNDFKKLITNYFVYSFLFVNDNKRKQKGSIDHTIIDILNDDGTEKPRRIIEAVKTLRNAYLNDYNPSETFKFENSLILYSIIDSYISTSNFLPMLYSISSGYNREHLIVHDNRGKKVTWVDEGNSFEFELSMIDNIDIYKRSTINYLIMQDQINASLGHNDIVKKISQIENEYRGNIPNHIALIIDHIRRMPSFIALQALKGQNVDHTTIVANYSLFIEEYFSENNQESMLAAIKIRFRASFQNQARNAADGVA